MSVTEIQLFQLLKAKPGEQEAEQLVSFVKEGVRTELDNKKEILATKEDIANTKEALANTKAEIIKWMFIFWIGQIIAPVAIILMYIKK